MTPVAGGIADGEKHGLILHARFLERFFAPRVPIHGVMGVLKKVLFVAFSFHDIIAPLSHKMLLTHCLSSL